MKKGLTSIVFVVDRSGSMSSIAKDTIGGFNQFIKVQKENNVGECKVSFIQFDDVYEEVFKNVNVADVKDLTDKTFVPRGYTALLDAVGKTIVSIGNDLSNTPEDQRPEKVLFVIITDGEENASKEYTADRVKELVTQQTNVYKWEFVYLGANQDAWSVGASIGIAKSGTSNYVSTGTNAGYSNDLMWNRLASKSVLYRACTSTDAKVEFTDAEQKEQDDLIKNNH